MLNILPLLRPSPSDSGLSLDVTTLPMLALYDLMELLRGKGEIQLHRQCPRYRRYGGGCQHHLARVLVDVHAVALTATALTVMQLAGSLFGSGPGHRPAHPAE